jgi:hypothetical protein
MMPTRCFSGLSTVTDTPLMPARWIAPDALMKHTRKADTTSFYKTL